MSQRKSFYIDFSRAFDYPQRGRESLGLEDENLSCLDGLNDKKFCSTRRQLLRRKFADCPRKNFFAAEGLGEKRAFEIFNDAPQKFRADF